MSEEKKPIKRSSADWEIIERDYRAGIKTLRQIAVDHGITHGAVNKRAKRDGWTRSSAAAVKQIEAARSVEDRSVVIVIPAIEDRYDRAGYVYGVFIDAGGERLYKIGLALQPDVRAAAHQTSLPFDARIGIAYYVPNMRTEERALHAMFADKLVRGEWFRLGAADLDAMAMRSRLA